MAEFLSGMKRTVRCGEVSTAFMGQEVTVMGWTNRRRDLGALIFVQIRDVSGIVQAVIDSTKVSKELFAKAETIKLEYVIAVKGKVVRRTAPNINPNMKTGEIEIEVSELRILSEAEVTPFNVGDSNAGEALRLKYRYLDLRREDLQHNLIVRSQIAQSARRYLSENGFLEIETPFLGKSTPEGARDYLVPSRVHQGKFYALPQSPQIYKQLLMVAGLDRYFQIAKCFRDEDLRANRQPEFTQIDIEMSFVDKEEDVFEIIEGLIAGIFKDVLNMDLKRPFNTMPYADAMAYYGSDKPDLRFDMKIKDLTDTVKGCGFGVFESAAEKGSVRCIVLKNHESDLSRKEMDKLGELVKTYRAKGLAYLGKTADGQVGRCSFGKFVSPEFLNKLFEVCEMENNDTAFIVADSNDEITCVSLGALRCHLAEKFDLIDKDKFEILWIKDFPLFEYSEEENRYVAKHHPFTSPKNEDVEFMLTDPARVRAKAYDLVINGEEAGGGSLRIYNRDIQKLMFEALGFTDEDIAKKFGFFVNAFNYGTPPHGGLAFGLDRLTMLLTHTSSIKDVIAFPKMQNACDLMTEAPNVVDDKQLRELGLEVPKKQND